MPVVSATIRKQDVTVTGVTVGDVITHQVDDATADGPHEDARSQVSPAPRLCLLRKWPDFDGYGFSIREERGRGGRHCLISVERHSPAEAVGLMAGDRLVEINGTNIAGENHRQVVQRVKAVPGETTLLVVDAETEDYYAERKIVISGFLPGIRIHTCPAINPYVDVTDDNNCGVTEDNNSANKKKRRLCKLKRKTDFDGFGFTMHENKNSRRHVVGKVEHNSPAESAGLLEEDRIIEVDGVNVEECGHDDVTDRIRSTKDGVSLLVVGTDDSEKPRQKVVMATKKSALPPTNGIALDDREPEDSKNLFGTRDKKQESKTKTITTNKTTGSVENNDNKSRKPRLCHLHLWPNFAGYGFTMHVEKDREGQYIGKVHDDSPAQAGGLKEGDRIIEVNGVNVEKSSHQDVAERVRRGRRETVVLVVDAETDRYYRENELTLSSSDLRNVIKIECPERGDEKDVSDSSTLSSAIVRPPPPTPTLRHYFLTINPTFKGYGFTMHLNKDKSAHLVGKVEPNSPAAEAGLKEGSRIVEVNGVNVEHEAHDAVAERIRRCGRDVGLLVDEACEEVPEMSSGVNRNESSTSENGTGSRPRQTKKQQGQQNTAYSPSSGSSSLETDSSYPYTLRRCVLRTWSHFDGYGFILATGADPRQDPSTGHYLSRVDAGSPAEAGGLLLGDRLIEVNDVNVESVTHKAVAEKVKELSGEAILLVIDVVADKYFKENKLLMSGDQPYVRNITCPAMQPPLTAKTTKSPTVSGSSSQTRPHNLRLCQLKLWPNCSEFGFTVHTDRDKPGQFIGKVDPDLPAHYAGLREGDRLIEVNGENVEKYFHYELSEKIRLAISDGGGKISLLVVDAVADQYFAERHAQLSSTQSFVVKLSTPTKRPKLQKVSPAPTKQDSVKDAKDSQPRRKDSATAKTESIIVSTILVNDSRITRDNSIVQQKDSIAQRNESVVGRDGHIPRLCVLKRWRNFKGFGFTMHHNEGSDAGGHIIGKVERNSPAEASGLREGDRVVEVNGVNVERLGHDETATRIRLGQGHGQGLAALLVVDPESDAYFSKNQIKLSSKQPFVKRILCPDTTPHLDSGNSNDADSPPALETKVASESIQLKNLQHRQNDNAEEHAKHMHNHSGAEDTVGAPSGRTVAPLVMSESKKYSRDRRDHSQSPEATAAIAAGMQSGTCSADSSGSGSGNGGVLEFSGSAKEARERMPKKSKVKDMNLSLKEKYDLFETL